MIEFLVLVTASLLSAGIAQDGCETVRTGLAPALAPCRESVRSCVENEDLGFETNLRAFCLEQARPLYNNFLRCEGAQFTNQIFGAICGGPSCAGEQTFASCQPEDGARCYNDAVISVNEGGAAFEACLCSNSSQNSSSPWCPMECADQLQQLVDDVGCCLNTAVYSFYFSTCGSSDGLAIEAPVTVLNNLFDACNIALPASCLHPFSPSSGGSTVTGTYLLVFGVLFLY